MSSIFRILKSNINQIIQSEEPVTMAKSLKSSKHKSKPNTDKKSKSVQSNNPFVLPFTKTKSIINEPNTNISISEQNPTSKQVVNKEKISPDTNTINSQIYWEYGNSGLKTKKLDKLMGKNLAILYYIDKIFACYNDLPNNSLTELFESKTKCEYKFGNSVISNEPIDGQPNVQIKLDLGVAKGTYLIESAGFTTISNIKIQEKDMIKNKIPPFDNFILRLDNLKELYKITNILNLTNRFEFKSNTSNPEFSLEKLMSNYNYILEMYKQENNERKLLRSSRDYAFYIKIYEKYNKAFVIDGPSNLIYYIVSNEDLNTGSIFIRYYSLTITNDYKIKSI